MSTEAMVAVWEESRQGGAALLIMLALADNADNDGYVWPNFEMVAKRCRCTLRQLSCIIDHLVSAGELSIERGIERRTGPGRYSFSTRYRIMLGSLAAESAQLETGTAYTKQPIPRRLRVAILERDGHYCRACGSTEDLTIDHIVPERLGGTLDPANLQVLCRTCNSRKGARAA
jgi:hypothetical protein